MSLELATAPTAEPISLIEAKLHLKVDAADEDALINTMIAAARGNLDGRAGWLGRALMPQVWKLHLHGFPGAGHLIRVPLPPLKSVDEIAYVDTAGAGQVLDPSGYVVDAVDNDGASPPAMIAPAPGVSWPSTRAQRQAVTVTFTAGFDDATKVPSAIKAALFLIVADLFANREGQGVGQGFHPNPTVQALLEPWRVWCFA